MINAIPIFVLIALTLGFCAILYPPVTQKIKAHERLYRINRFRKTMAFNSIEEAVKNVITSNLKSMIPYLLYFFFVINTLVSKLGKIEYGDNEPYFIFLIFVGIPYVVCFIHFVLRIYFQEMIIKKSNFEKDKANALIFTATFSVPLIMLLYVQKVLHFANHHPVDLLSLIR